MIRYLHRNEIDTGKWDEVISSSQVETIYPYSWYLDASAANWSGLVVDDYRFIMPVVWKQKYGLKYLYQPFYTQQLGVFSKEYVDPVLIMELLVKLRKKFRFASINLNTRNLVGEEHPFTVYDKSNYVLSLGDPYEKIYTSFSTNTKRNIKRAREAGVDVTKDVSCAELVAFKRENDVIKRSEEEYRWLINLLDVIQKNSTGSVYAHVKDGILQAATFFGFSKTRGIYLVSASNAMGKADRSMFKLVDTFIHEHAGSGLLLDFEGSNIPNVARFFAGFGARPEIYQGVNFDRLPVFLNKLRKSD